MCVQQQLLMIYWCVDTTSESERYYYEAPNQNLEEGQKDKKNKRTNNYITAVRNTK